jgi:phosphate/sulfate permease
VDINFIILVILIFLAIIDLTVGVANDAVNFLNSAIGANVAKLKTIMIVAAVGVLVGVLVSGGMMEVARKGIFNPQYFLMPELMIIFISVMFLDILLLDTFNTFGLPTSTTVSIVFGLFGSGLAMSIVKISQTTSDYSELATYMNVSMVLTIILAILLSILMAFVFGMLVQYLTRLLFSFDFEKRFNRYGALWGSLALTAISFFILLKGAKNTDFMKGDFKVYFIENMGMIFLYLYAFWTVVLFLLQRVTKINVLKLIVLIGTFALAMAFAANDLVNFIGAPIAALSAYDIAQATSNPLTADMGAMQGKMPANTYILLLSGAIMVATLFISKKARSVATTTISLGRQDEGYERFESNAIARSLVRMTYGIFSEIKRLIPKSVVRFVNSRFDTTKYTPQADENGVVPSFDLLRAAVILFVSSALISLATYKKLPLSTTYVTFIVAMAAALPDKAWGRDSAVYRVSGVLTVVGGWFVTAIFGTIGAMIICFTIYYGQWVGLLAVFALTAFTIYRSAKFHKENEEKHRQAALKERKEETNNELANKKIMLEVSDFLTSVSKTFVLGNEGLITEDLKKLKKSKKKANDVENNIVLLNSNIIKHINKFDYEDSEYANLAIRMTISLQDISDKLYHSISQNYKYVNNNHKPLTAEEIELLTLLNDKYKNFFGELTKSFSEYNFENYEHIKSLYKDFMNDTTELYRNQLKRIKKQKSTVRRSIILLNLISDFELQSELSFKVFEFAKISRSQL